MKPEAPLIVNGTERDLESWLRAALKGYGRRLTKSELVAANSILTEYMKPSEKAETGAGNPEWLYLEYRRAKKVEHELLRERAERKNRLALNPGLSTEARLEDAMCRIRELETTISGFISAIRWVHQTTDSMPDPLLDAFAEALQALGLHTHQLGRLEAEAGLKAAMNSEAKQALERLSNLFALEGMRPLWRSLPDGLRDRITSWRMHYLQLISAEQHAREAEVRRAGA